MSENSLFIRLDQANEDALSHQLRELLDFYRTIEKSLAELEQSAAPDDFVDTSRLNDVLLMMRGQQETYQTVLKLWKAANGHSKKQREMRAEIEAILERLIQTVGDLEERAEAKRSSVLPGLDAVAKDRQANAAYQKGASY